mmetsp:Transcript_41994/g.75645  ORF Transcript_41994/g.75645 Transcript_41994/m.75645 type:complete len:717 (+) Transcript_41994:92-2242(+)|eukprot:CAMPEP_0201916146 /NCGR_PEP_ID=MMETSP0903-20130614/5845_1 /ASSEMBLY_ACC=CAM_ASM_000552 /TAXON_ID=420261 /ORGANISM="Thalassiosira antarctica, Strain CCMP982" /LENGTH=716 /DNA_ID=CAMNT_0048451887 /DNA_START=40 /DNA_END=2190 /DNA_ORIENTATION=+
MNVRNDSDVILSMSNLGESNRSGQDIDFPEEGTGLHHPTENMQEGNVKEKGGNRKEVPVATPASSHDDPSINILSRLKAASIPPHPMMANAVSNPISPATPMLHHVGIAGMSANTPTSAQSQGSRTLAALYQSSRRSRTNTPRKSGTAIAPPTMFPPPPPLFSAPSTDVGHQISMLPSQQLGISGSSNVAAAGDDIHKVSLQSSNASSSLFHESWNTSYGSLMNSSFMNTSFSNVYNFPGTQSHSTAIAPPPPQPTVGEKLRQFQRPNLMEYKIQDRNSCRRLSDESHDHSLATADPLPTPTDEWSRQMQQQNLMDSMMEDDKHKKSPCVMPTIPTLLPGGGSKSPENSPSPFTGCMDQFPSLQVRSREEFELRQGNGGAVLEEKVDYAMGDGKDKAYENDKDDNTSSENDEGGDDRKEPPKKKNKRKNSVSYKLEEQCLTPQTYKSCMSSASFDIIAHPSSRVSSINEDTMIPLINDADADVDELLKKDVNLAELYEINAEKDLMKEVGQQEQGTNSKVPPEEDTPQDQMHHVQDPKETRRPKKETPSEKDQRLLRRKVQRLLLIRHCSTCPIPPPLTITSATPDHCSKVNDGGELIQPRPSAVCPVTSHCAEGKALCAHIRTCKLENCKYKKCLTSREVMGHFKNCRDVTCGICGSVRALDRKHKGPGGFRKQRRRTSDSSIETIDDEGWLNANMTESDRHINGVPMLDSGGNS